MDAKHAWFFPAPRAGSDPESNYNISERESAAGYLSKGRVFGVPMRRRYAGVPERAAKKLNEAPEGADALSFSGT